MIRSLVVIKIYLLRINISNFHFQISQFQTNYLIKIIYYNILNIIQVKNYFLIPTDRDDI